MHCALHIIGFMSDSWNMQRLHVEGASPHFVRPRCSMCLTLSYLPDDNCIVHFGHVYRVLSR
jgi:hypothetical protein